MEKIVLRLRYNLSVIARHYKLLLRLLPIVAGALIALTLLLAESNTMKIVLSLLVAISALVLMLLLRGYVWALEDNELS